MPRPIPPSALCSSGDPKEKIHATFAEHGFCVFRNFLDEAAVKEAVKQIETFIAKLSENDSIPAQHVMRDDANRPTTLKQIQMLHQHCPYFGEEIMEGKMRTVAEAALGEAVVAKNMQYFNKPPLKAYSEGKGSLETPPHQAPRKPTSPMLPPSPLLALIHW